MGGWGCIVKKKTLPLAISCDLTSFRVAELILQEDKAISLEITEVYNQMWYADNEEMKQFYKGLESLMQKTPCYRGVSSVHGLEVENETLV
ncbi:unnamed protein product [Soboliphyme baturini]|uniref:FGGY_N domain-containing protein n=1 Tax=Soboliphyme baturini TaxID=241478 RepID=A0A183J4M8_9BILA|nr:unnamed protein product [Soboliphyme baturini]